MAKKTFLFSIGGFLYSFIEILWRGRTHISMFFAGGFCLVLINKYCLKQHHPVKRCLLGSSIITVVEFVTGLVVNRLLKLQVWDYSAMPMNIMGQVCPLYSFLWCFLTIPAVSVCNLVQKRFAER